MKDQTVLVKRSIEKDGKPEQEGYYLTGEGKKYFDGNKWWSSKSVVASQEFAPMFYYVGIPLSSLIESIMPTEDEMINAKYRLAIGTKENTNIYRAGFKEGIEYLKTQLTSKP